MISQGALDFLQRLCDEAVTACGGDVPQIERHVAAALANLPADERQAFHEAVSRFLEVQRALNDHVRRPRALS
ncbi:MAG TPA: hypothetical protein VHD15_08240 [Hyphomicrobiales bacterium]|nr:hypothetical protein [Hyphomicrobiales bacterium]